MNKIFYTLGTSVELHTENEVQLGTVFLKVTRFSYICMNLYIIEWNVLILLLCIYRDFILSDNWLVHQEYFVWQQAVQCSPLFQFTVSSTLLSWMNCT